MFSVLSSNKCIGQMWYQVDTEHFSGEYVYPNTFFFATNC
jgi:hypothetical protein